MGGCGVPLNSSFVIRHSSFPPFQLAMRAISTKMNGHSLSKGAYFVLAQVLVRVGVLGHVGRFTSVDGARYPRAARVVCRTRRGLEVGEVLSDVEAPTTFDSDGAVLRRVSVED